MRSMAALVVALGLVVAAPAAAQSDLSGLGGKTGMPVTMAIERASLADALSLLADAADIEIRVEAAAATGAMTAKFNNARFGEVLAFLLEQRKLKATVFDPKTVVVSAIPGQEPPPAVAAPQSAPAVIRLKFEIYKNQESVAKPMLAIASGSTGSVNIRNVASISVTPSAVDAERVTVAFEITSGATTIKPQLGLNAEEPGSISWSSASGADNFELRVTRMR